MNKKSYDARALATHKKLGGKLSVVGKAPLKTKDDLSIFYTPGVGAVSKFLATHRDRVREFTIKKNTVAVISDGSAVLGLGNIGWEGALPVMEGKAMLFKAFAGIDAFPIVLDTQDVDEIVETVRHIAPAFGGINLEDISAPRCFEIERRLIEALPIPVMHDDQHGTAIVVLAGLLNALRVVKKSIQHAKIVIVGAGAAGTAIARLLALENAGEIVVVDSTGIISARRQGISGYKKELAAITNRKNLTGTVGDALVGADAVIGVSVAGALSAVDVGKMAARPIVFAMANPIPEIMPDVAIKAGAAVVATGRSDFPNQINNVLVFPGVFRGALDGQITAIDMAAKQRAAHALARLVQHPTATAIIPSPFDPRVVTAVARAVKKSSAQGKLHGK
jgi:malate dehydrogenase (oxaloacetate-decarboxylating)